MSAYRDRIFAAMADTLAPLGALRGALDFGSGDGYFAARVGTRLPVGGVTAVDVVERSRSEVRPLLYDGKRLPFADAQFELAYAIDVLHHCPDPQAALADLSRCAGRYLLLKDHNQSGMAGRFALAVMDELGNRRFGIPSPYLYQKDWAWVRWLEAHGWQRRAFVHPMRCHVGAMGALTNGLQFLGLWERTGG